MSHKMTYTGPVTRMDNTRWDQPSEGENKKGRHSLQVNLAGGIQVRAYEGQQLYKDLTSFVRIGDIVTIEAVGYRDASYSRSVNNESGGESFEKVNQIELLEAELMDFSEAAVSTRFADRVVRTEPLEVNVKLSQKRANRQRGTGDTVVDEAALAAETDKY